MPALKLPTAIAPAKVALTTIALVVAVIGCELFYDSATPPFSDRMTVTTLVDDVFGDLRRSDVTMTVLMNDDQHHLVVRGRGKGGDERTAVFDKNLKMVMNRSGLWDISNAFVDSNGNFVIDRRLFDRDFTLLSDEAYTDLPPGERVTGMATPSGVVLISVEDETIWGGPRYDEDWNFVDGTGPTENEIHPEAAENDTPLGGFGLLSSQHDTRRDRTGLVLWNQNIARVFVVEVSASLAEELADPGLAEFLTDSAPYVVISARDYTPVFYTRRGIVVVRDHDEHAVLDLESGRVTDTYSIASSGDFAFAYSPDGRWVYTLDESRLRLYKARVWW